jgi:hypothetical protein
VRFSLPKFTLGLPAIIMVIAPRLVNNALLQNLKEILFYLQVVSNHRKKI